MARIAFILLAHKDAEGVIDQARRLTATGDYVAIHFDARAPKAIYQRLQDGLAGMPGIVYAPRRWKCGWGEWSLVGATLETLRAAEAAFPKATHFYMLSGDCMPIKSAEYAHRILDRDDVDFIESFDFFASDWIKTGIRKERLIYRHWFNERKQKNLFYTSLWLQRRLGLARDLPADLQIMIGSQWWCLRRQTIEAILALLEQRRDIARFFSTTWIPDETFFQTLVAHLVPRAQIRSRTLTFLLFSDYGMPVTFYNDHYDLLLRQNYLFARKISPEALELRQRLGLLWQTRGQDFAIADEGARLFAFLVGRGRVGRRFAPRFWETEGSVGAGRVLNIVVAKKWHVAKHLTARIRALTDIPAVDYLFNEIEANLPDLGGIATTLAKRQRHRRALVNLLFDQFENRQLVICADPSALELIRDLANDRAEVRVLFVDSKMDDSYLRGHMARVGLISDSTPEKVIENLLPVVRADLEHEADLLKTGGLSEVDILSESGPTEDNAAAIGRFLGVDENTALALARTPYLFTD